MVAVAVAGARLREVDDAKVALGAAGGKCAGHDADDLLHAGLHQQSHARVPPAMINQFFCHSNVWNT